MEKKKNLNLSSFLSPFLPLPLPPLSLIVTQRDSLIHSLIRSNVPFSQVYFEERGAVDTLKQVQQLHKHFPSMAELAERR
jgi:hypothetical protein